MRRAAYHALAIAACLIPCVAAAAEGSVSLEPVGAIEGCKVPECALPGPDGKVFLSNIEAGEDEYWSNDGKGFIMQADPTGKVVAERWLDSTEKAPLNAPKGMCILEDYLFFTDNDRLIRVPLDKKYPVVEVPLPHTQELNDLATDGTFVYTTDTALSMIYKVGVNGGQTILQAPPSVNGVTCFKGKIFAVSWGEHDLYEIDPSGDKPPVAFGLANHFTTLDGIELLDDGTFLVSDFDGNKVCSVSADRKTVNTLVEVETPADIGLDRGKGLLYVPLLTKDRIEVFRIVSK